MAQMSFADESLTLQVGSPVFLAQPDGNYPVVSRNETITPRIFLPVRARGPTILPLTAERYRRDCESGTAGLRGKE